jgi:2-polyprenyl-3-methyl-5-hydroxy-6-metoxy-1,4-benzoquinol methylase
MKNIRWLKETDLNSQGKTSVEKWIRNDGLNVETFNMDLYLGKKTNLLGLKSDIVKNIKEKVKYYRESRQNLYAGDKVYVDKCPVTNSDTAEANLVANIYGAEYVQSPNTGHVYVKYRPSEGQINDYYLNNVTYAATYTDKNSAEIRLNSIAIPWLEWSVSVYEKHYGRKPKKILDVGSGAGHFVEACRRYGLDAEGIELSESSRKFAKNVWGINLAGDDFTQVTESYNNYDIITFWGLLEHTPNPAIILDSGYKVLGKAGMVISKLPRWLSLGSAAQRLNPESIIRHIDPMGHIMLFTDASAAELYYRANFKPIAAWYYGMDIYEMLMQLGNNTGYYDTFLKSGEQQIELQQFVDEQRFSDGLTLVGIPNK